MDVSLSKEKKQKGITIFCCYAHEDEGLLNKLKGHLSPLRHLGLITVWYDRNISPGAVWEKEIKQHLNEAQILFPAYQSRFYGLSVLLRCRNAARSRATRER